MFTVTLDEYHRMPGFVRDAIDEWVNACGYNELLSRGLIAVAVGDDASTVELTYGSPEPNRVTQRVDWANPVTVTRTAPSLFPVDTVAEWYGDTETAEDRLFDDVDRSLRAAGCHAPRDVTVIVASPGFVARGTPGMSFRCCAACAPFVASQLDAVYGSHDETTVRVVQ